MDDIKALQEFINNYYDGDISHAMLILDKHKPSKNPAHRKKSVRDEDILFYLKVDWIRLTKNISITKAIKIVMPQIPLENLVSGTPNPDVKKLENLYHRLKAEEATNPEWLEYTYSEIQESIKSKK